MLVSAVLVGLGTFPGTCGERSVCFQGFLGVRKHRGGSGSLSWARWVCVRVEVSQVTQEGDAYIASVAVPPEDKDRQWPRSARLWMLMVQGWCLWSLWCEE